MSRDLIREMLAEFLGTFVLIVFGVGVVAQVVLSKQTAGTFLSINIAWGLAVTMGCYVCAGVTGAHLNPAVTIALAMHRGFPWNKVAPVLDRADRRRVRRVGRRLHHLPRRAERVRRRRAPGARRAGHGRHLGDLSAAVSPARSGGIVDQVVGTALLVGVILGITDERNAPAPKGLVPVVVGLLVLLIGATFGFNAGYAINPARDFGPRLFTVGRRLGRRSLSRRERLVVGADCRASGRRRGRRLGLRSVRRLPPERAREHHRRCGETVTGGTAFAVT